MSFQRVNSDLPVFRVTRDGLSFFYAPGRVAHVLSGELRRYAAEAVQRWKNLAQARFAPECLTVYLNNRCNLACGYCFAAPERKQAAEPVEPDAVKAAARLVAGCCVEKAKPFFLVLHGGGEPALNWDSVLAITALTREVAARSEIGWRGYIATNGVLSAMQTEWLAREFDFVTISCDGPPDIQNRQRPTVHGNPTSGAVENTARLLRRAGKEFAVRCTITKNTLERQTGIVEYLSSCLSATEIRFAPVYGAAGDLTAADAGPFARHFLAAQAEARHRGCDLQFSGCRLDEIHGPYCNVLRDTLTVLPDGSGTACFLCTTAREADAKGQGIGAWDRRSGTYWLDRRRIEQLRAAATAIPAACGECINVYHCARACPDRCHLEGPDPGVTDFACLVNRYLAEEWLWDAARALTASS